MNEPVLEAIKNRRSVLRFETTPIEEDKVQTILEAGRWAPSWLNRQPWKFIIVADQKVRERLSEYVPTVFNQGIKEAPIAIVVCVDTEKDPYHFVEDGAAATQNMALAAHSLSLGSCWIGVFHRESGKDSAEERIKQLLRVPASYRVISVLPIGVPKYAEEKSRKELFQLVHRDEFQ